jgi:hypothetical protein
MATVAGPAGAEDHRRRGDQLVPGAYGCPDDGSVKVWAAGTCPGRLLVKIHVSRLKYSWPKCFGSIVLMSAPNGGSRALPMPVLRGCCMPSRPATGGSGYDSAPGACAREGVPCRCAGRLTAKGASWLQPDGIP